MAIKSMIHLNHNMMCAIDCETTGRAPGYHEIIQLAIVPLDNFLEPRKDVPIFDIKMRPNHINRIDPDSMTVNKLELQTIIDTGVDREKAFELFEHYFKKLKLPIGKKIVPLGYNVAAFDLPFINDWMGNHAYREYIFGHSRDALLAACFLNDVADQHIEQVPFANLKLRQIARQLDIEVLEERVHDALYDAYLAAQVYKRLITHYLAGRVV